MPRPSVTRARPYTPTRGALAGRTFTSERQYRNALERAHGRTTLYAAQRQAKPARTIAQLERLRPSEQAARDRALHALAAMRRDPTLSLRDAAKDAGTTANAVQRYGGSALEKRGGRYRPSKQDRLVRVMHVLTVDGEKMLAIKDSRAASLVGRHQAAIRRYIHAKDEAQGEAAIRQIRALRGKFITVDGRRHYLAYDLEDIERRARAGELSFESLYETAA